jgi:hypothetical protein
MSPAACAGSSPGPRSESLGTAGLLRVFSETSTAFVGVQLGLVLELKAADLEAVFYGALLKDGGWGAVLVSFFADPGTGPSARQPAAARRDRARVLARESGAELWERLVQPFSGSLSAGASPGPVRAGRQAAPAAAKGRWPHDARVTSACPVRTRCGRSDSSGDHGPGGWR